MRAGYVGNIELMKLTERAVPAADYLVEALITVAEDMKDSKTDWTGVDGFPNTVEYLPDGGVRLKGTIDNVINFDTHTAPSAADMTELGGPFSSPVDVAVVEWEGSGNHLQAIHTLRAYLHPNYGGTGKQVATWIAQGFRLARVRFDEDESATRWELQRITEKVYVPATLSVAGYVDFQFTSNQQIPLSGPPPTIEDGETAINDPATVFFVWAAKADGSPAGNVAWLVDNSNPTGISNGHLITGYQIRAVSSRTEESRDSEYADPILAGGAPRLQIVSRVYTAATLTFSTNRLNLGGVPALIVELVAEGHEPGGSTLVWEVFNGTIWLQFADGDRVGVDNTGRGGFNLTSLAVQQFYSVRVTLNPSPNQRVTPYAKRVGVREIDTEVLDEDIEVGSDLRWAVDPFTLKPETPRCTIDFAKTGIRDYRSLAEELFSKNYVGDLEFRLWWGHRKLPRRYWLHIDDVIPETHDPRGPTVQATCVSPLAKLHARIPIRDTIQLKREPAVYIQASHQAVYDDLMSGQMGVPGRYVGPGITDTATTLTKTIDEEVVGKDEISRVAWLGGGAIISSQGRLKFVDFETKSAPVEFFAMDEVQVLGVELNLDKRLTTYGVRHGWDPNRNDGRGGFAGEVFATSDQALAALDRALIEPEDELDEDTAQWIEQDFGSDPPTSALADRIGSREIEWRATGSPVLVFQASGYPRPFLEPGDVVGVQTDELVVRDPFSGQAIRGPVWVIARIVMAGRDARTFGVWIQSYLDIFPGAIDLKRLGFATPIIRDSTVRFQTDGTPEIDLRGNRDCGSFRAAAKTTLPFATRGAVDIEAPVASDENQKATISFPALQVPVGGTVYISALGYETPTGAGASSLQVYEIQATRELLDPLEVAIASFAWVPQEIGPWVIFLLGSWAPLMSFLGGSEVVSVQIQFDFTNSLGAGTVNTAVGVGTLYTGPQMDAPASIFTVTVTGYDAPGGAGGGGKAGDPVIHRFPGPSGEGLIGSDPQGGIIPFQVALSNSYVRREQAQPPVSGWGPGLEDLPPIPWNVVGINGNWAPPFGQGVKGAATLNGATTVVTPSNWPGSGSGAFMEILVRTTGQTLTLSSGVYQGPDLNISGGLDYVLVLEDFGEAKIRATVFRAS